MRGVNKVTPIRRGSLLVMCSELQWYLGEVLGIYQYGSTSGKHDSFTKAETLDNVSYLSLKVFQHVSFFLTDCFWYACLSFVVI